MRYLRSLLIALVLWTLPATAQDLPAFSNVYVNDFADVLSPETEISLTTMIQKARRERDHEMTVVTINSVNDYTPELSIERFSKVLFNTWGVGNAEHNDGIMLVVAVKDRNMRIQLGSGYSARYDGIAARIIDSIMVPAFKANDMERGIIEGVEASLARLRLGPIDTSEMSYFERFALWKDDNPIKAFVAMIGGILAIPLTPFLAFLGARWGFRNRPRKCPECGRVMLRLGDKQEDQYLDEGQIFEEQIKSKDYGVWFCEHDEHLTIIGYPRAFSKHKACPQCGYHTYETRSTTMRAATTQSGGLKRLDSTCKKCGHYATRDVATARLTRSSSSSGIGGGSSGGFGGGSSSGGGASGSW
ncbi:MAG: TPM domain-containing protein [Pseudomonadota bacterium]